MFTKTILVLSALISSSVMAQSITLEHTRSGNETIDLSYGYSTDTGRAVVRAEYLTGITDDMMGESANFSVEGLSYDAANKQIIFDNGVNTYVCADVTRFRVRSTGICSLDVDYSKEVRTSDDGLNTRTYKVNMRTLTLTIKNDDAVETKFAVKKIRI